MAPDFAVVGCLTLDSVINHDGHRYARAAGGNVLYTALGARVWTDRVGIISRAGADYPTSTLTALSDLGVDTSGVTVLDGRHEFLVAFAYDADGHRTRVVPPDLMATLPPAERPAYVDTTSEEVLRVAYAADPGDLPADWLAGTRGWLLASLPRTKQQALALELRSRTPPGTAVLADGVDAKDLGPGVGLSDFGYVAVLDVLLPSEVDLTVPGLDEPFTRMTAFLSLGVPTVVMKFGPRGSVVLTEQGSWHVPVAAVRAVDPTGAGDAYCGGFTVGYADTRDPLEAAVYGTVAASYTVECDGLPLHQPAPRAEVERRAEQVRSSIRRIRHDPREIASS